MMDVIGPIFFGIICTFGFYIAWLNPKRLKKFLGGIYTGSWPAAQQLANSNFTFWAVRIFTLLMFLGFVAGFIGFLYQSIR